MRYLLIILLFISICSCRTNYELITTDKPHMVGVKSNHFKGTIFKQSYPLSFFAITDSESSRKFTPTKEDIADAENILKDQIRSLNNSLINQVGNCPIIHKNLNDYFRQYVGFYDNEGNKIIHINMLWDRYTLRDRLVGSTDSRAKYNDDYKVVNDGCSFYWQINVNLTTKKLSDLLVNGVG